MSAGSTVCQSWTRRNFDASDVNVITAGAGMSWTAGNNVSSNVGNFKFRKGLSDGATPPVFSSVSDLYGITPTETQNYVNLNMMNNDIDNIKAISGNATSISVENDFTMNSNNILNASNIDITDINNTSAWDILNIRSKTGIRLPVIIDTISGATEPDTGVLFQTRASDSQHLHYGSTACQQFYQRGSDGTTTNIITASGGMVWTAGDTGDAVSGNYKFRTAQFDGASPPVASSIVEMYRITATETQNYVNFNMMSNDITAVNQIGNTGGTMAIEASTTINANSNNFESCGVISVNEIESNTPASVAIIVSSDIDMSNNDVSCNDIYLKGAFYNAGTPTDIPFGDNIDMSHNDIVDVDNITNTTTNITMTPTNAVVMSAGKNITLEDAYLQISNPAGTYSPGAPPTMTGFLGSIWKSGGNLFYNNSGGVYCLNAPFYDRGTVTQLTSISTGVTLNKTSGTITTVSTVLASSAFAIFTVTNSTVSATSLVSAQITDYSIAYSGGGHPHVNVDNISAGSFDIALMNSGGSALGGILKIQFTVYP
jgi:hypothetical protein